MTVQILYYHIVEEIRKMDSGSSVHSRVYLRIATELVECCKIRSQPDKYIIVHKVCMFIIIEGTDSKISSVPPTL
jgi:hypothetical protein